jgi:hypothetical protein
VLLVAAAFAAALFSLGDAGDATGARPAPLTPAELRWIRGYARWSIEVEAADLGKPAGRDGLIDCAAVLRSTAGRLPTERLREAAAFVDDACAALTSGQTETVVREDLAHADELLSPLLLSSTRLRETDEATVESRRSPVLGAIASAHAREAIEVQCWSERDWRRVIREDNAWSDTEDDYELVDGMAYLGEGRIQMLLGDCNLLGRLRDENVADRNREGLVAAAGALAVFSHEIQHFRLPDGTEAEVECAGAAALARVGRALGVDGRENDLLATVYAESIRPQLAHEYVKRCKDS